MTKATILPVGDAAILVEFGRAIDPAIQARVGALDEALNRSPHPAIVEWVPTYRSLLVHYDPLQIGYEELAAWLEQQLQQEVRQSGLQRRQVTIPVLYGGEMGPDLETVATHNNLTPEEVIALHQEPNYLVYMLGFMPGFPYLGGLDERLATPRLATPRTHVPAGSVGIADRQTGVYPLDSPGGWQLIGRTPLKLYDPNRPQPFLLAAGDELRFQAITEDEYRAILAEQEQEGAEAGCAGEQDPTSGATHGQPLKTVRVINPGLFTTVQDLGRKGWQRFGVPVAGVFDPLAAKVANWLVGNEEEAALLEITYAGPTLVTDTPLMVAITGGQVDATLEGEPVPLWQSFLWQPGQELKIGTLIGGARAYLAVQGGWQVPVVMGSRSTYVRAKMGGVAGRQLQAGDQLPVVAQAPTGPFRRLPAAFWPSFSREIILRFVPGPQTDHFAPAAVEQLCASSYTIGQASDRMGIRLQGQAIEPLQPDIVSDAIALGSIQVPRDGQPIVMGPDRQTTGGYPKVGTVICPDMRRLAQARPGDKVRFQAITSWQAQDLVFSAAEQLQKLRRLVDKEVKGKEYRVKVEGSAYHTFVEEISG